MMNVGDTFSVSSKSLKRKAKDSIFTSLFRDPENVAKLYKDLHPELNNVKTSDINIMTLVSVFVDSIYNDLGFVVKENGKDKLIVLVEAQSTWNPNMPFRIWCYLSETYRDYIRKTGQNVYGGKKVNLPMPEMYLIFTGNRKKKIESMSLGDDFFGGKVLRDMNVHVLYEADNTIYGEYIYFCKTLDKNRNLYPGDTKKIVTTTIDECEKRGCLTKFLENHRGEIYNMVDDLFDKKYWLECRDKEKIAEGEARGRAEGRAEGEAKGRAEGRAEGEAKGRAEGRAEGKIDMLIELVKDGSLTLEQAANKSNMSIEEFKKIAGLK